MPRKSKKPVRKQTHSPTGKVVGQVGQILLPMIAGIAATKADLTEWVYEQGLTALHLLLREDAEKIAGPKGKHEKERTHNHWGSTDGELSFGGRRIQVSRPRVRSKSGEEASLPHFEAFREEDPLPERVLNQILVGVSTRNYESSLDKPSAKLKSRGTSKSAASRHLVSQTTKKLEEYLSRRLEEFELAALMMDGLEVAGQTVVVTLGITIDGTKVPLGIWLGSTENSRVCTAMLQNLLERGLRIDESILCVVDGGKGSFLPQSREFFLVKWIRALRRLFGGPGEYSGPRHVQKHKRVAKPLMVALSTIMIDELGDGPTRVLEFVCISGHDAVRE